MRTLANKEPSNQDSAHQKPVKKAPVPIVRSLSTGLPMLQRKHGCACGGGCPRCQSQALLQTKLRIGEPGDKYEQEADRVAEEVMRMPEPKLQRQVEPEEEEEDEDKMVQTKAIVNRVAPLAQRREASEVPTIVREVLNSPGQPLAPETRTFMESCFGHDFNQIRVHTDAKAAESAAEMNAEAYTVKHNIVFATGRYAPDTQPGRQLLAHELTHSLQQSETHSLVQLQKGEESSTPAQSSSRPLRIGEHVIVPDPENRPTEWIALSGRTDIRGGVIKDVWFDGSDYFFYVDDLKYCLPSNWFRSTRLRKAKYCGPTCPLEKIENCLEGDFNIERASRIAPKALTKEECIESWEKSIEKLRGGINVLAGCLQCLHNQCPNTNFDLTDNAKYSCIFRLNDVCEEWAIVNSILNLPVQQKKPKRQKKRKRRQRDWEVRRPK